MAKIKLLGAGPSGLSAAINLSKEGYDVEVFERGKDCGQRFQGDLQGLENWSKKENVLRDLKRMNIKINFDCDAFSTIRYTNGAKMAEIHSNNPLFYLVKRGSIKGSLDSGLKQHALENGVKIRFKSTIPEKEADIVATGPNMKEVFGIDKGIVFKTKMKDLAVGLINNKAAYKGYSYLLVTKGYGCMCTVLFDEFGRINGCLEETKRIFSKLFKLHIKNPKPVGGVGSFSLQNKFQENGRLYIGEAAGIQDLLAGFGIRNAITSGYLAAESIIKHLNYERVAKEYFSDKLRVSFVNRFLFEKLANNFSGVAITAAKNIKNPRESMYKIYNTGIMRKLIFPIAKFSMRKRYKNLPI